MNSDHYSRALQFYLEFFSLHILFKNCHFVLCLPSQRMECSTGVPFQAWTVCPLAASGSCTTFEVHRNVNCIRTVPARPTVQWFLIFPAWLPSALLSWHSHESHITPLPENRVEIIYQAYVAAPLLTFLGNWGAANYRYLALFAWEKKSLQFPTILFYLSTYF